MPKDFDTVAVWYNKEIFDSAGVEYPNSDWTWEEFVETAKALTDTEKGIYGAAVQLDEQAGWYNTIGSFGGWVISEDKKESGFGDPKTQAGIQCWVDLINEGISPSYGQLNDTNSNTLFESGKLAMQWNGSWAVSEYAGIDEIKDKIDIVEVPSVDGKKSSVIHGLGNVIFSKSKNPDEAWKFVEFLGSKEAMDMQANAATAISARTESTPIWAEAHPEYNLQAYMNAEEYSYPYPASANTSAWSTPMYDEVYAAFNGDKTVEDACKELEATMNAALAAE
jgi:multiple sugar transport system substrate-binding protein